MLAIDAEFNAGDINSNKKLSLNEVAAYEDAIAVFNKLSLNTRTDFITKVILEAIP